MKRGRPLKKDKLNANIALRLQEHDRKVITRCAEMMHMSTNRFVLDACLAVTRMINGTEKGSPRIVKLGRFIREKGL